MDRIIETPVFLEFYGELLTKRQAEIMAMYCDDDYSLAEIAENLHVSRQAVHDSIRSGISTLEELEEKMGLVRKYKKRAEIANDIIDDLSNPEFLGDGCFVKKRLDGVIEKVREFIDI